MTWAEFKAEMERQGAKDDDLISHIDVSDLAIWNITVLRDDDGRIGVA